MSEFAGTLTQRITIERPMTSRTPMGALEAGWEPFARCFAAVAPEGAGPESEAMALSAMPRFKVTIRVREGVAIDQRIRWSGTAMMIRQIITDPRFNDRLVLRCEEVRAS